jgi:succinoglycan biosynthesis protein ExoM
MTSEQATSEPCDLSVVICTVNRPVLLAKAVASAAGQENRLGLATEIVVVDNSAEGRARETVERLARQHSVPVCYVSERRMSFAYARNAGVAAARGALIAFLDDDEEASPRWSDALVETLRRFDADVVFGPILPVFEGGRPPAWDPEGHYYSRHLDVPSGTEVSERGTGNALMKRIACGPGDEPFAHDLGSSGGEDIDLFLRLKAQGRKLVWAAEATVTELQPKETLTLGYRSYRNFCLNQTYVRIRVRNSDKRLVTMLRFMAMGAAQVVVFSLPGLASCFAHARPLIAARMKLCNGLGKLLWMMPSQLYSRRYRSRA